MPTVQFGGAISGIDTKSLIDAMMQAESGPLTRLQQRRTSLQAIQKEYTKLSGLIADLQTKAKAFTVNRFGASKLASSSDSKAFSASASPSAAVGSYQIVVDRLATATRATSTVGIGTAVTDTSKTLASLNLPGGVTAGTVSVVVDGSVVQVAVGDPSTTSLQSLLDPIGGAIATKIQATDPAATVTAGVSGNHVEFTVSGASGSHTVKFGAGGDTSNALGILGLTSLATQTISNGSVTGTTSLGVVKTTGALDAAGLTGLASTTTGSLSINGVAIAYDTTKDSLTDVISRINLSTAGVVASLDRTNDRIVLTNRGAGASVIAINDTAGTLGAALALGPGTTAAQTLGQSSRVFVDGREVVADSNKVTTAVDGVTLDLLASGTGQATLTIGADRTVAKQAMTDFVTAFNKLADELETATQNAPGKTKGVLAGDAGVSGLLFSLRQSVLAPSGLGGTIRALGDIGVSTGVVGSALGTTKRLVFDEAKFDTALDADPARVADLLNGSSGAISPFLARLDSLTKTDGVIDATQDGVASELALLDKREASLQQRLDVKRAALERKYAALEATLAQLQSQGQSAAAQASKLGTNG